MLNYSTTFTNLCLLIYKNRLDATALKMVTKHNGDLGKQRLFGVIGQAIFVILRIYYLSFMYPQG